MAARFGEISYHQIRVATLTMTLTMIIAINGAMTPMGTGGMTIWELMQTGTVLAIFPTIFPAKVVPRMGIR
jgi:hypothetical protein